MKRKHQEEAAAGAPAWMVTFADMMTLLMCFFVLLLSFSSMEVDKFKLVAGYMREAFNSGGAPLAQPVDMGMNVISDDSNREATLSDELIQIQMARESLDKAGLGANGNVRVTDRGVALRVDGDAAFDTGKATLSEAMKRVLDEIAATARDRPGAIELEGHTDDVPIAGGRYPSNWELSSARAGAAARYLIGRGVPSSRIKAVGYADTRPVAPNTGADNRAKNRRIEILFVGERT